MSVERKLAAVMFTDIVGFTKIMTDSEDTAISILKAQDDIFNPLLEKFSGNLLKKMGDGLLVEFSSAVNAVDCALNIQSSIKEYNQTDGDEFHIRIGIHLGDVLMLGDDILGDGVNVASRIEPLAAPDGICITEAVQQSIKSKLKVDARRISEVDLKHIDDKYTLYKIPNVEDDSELVNELDISSDKIIINNFLRLTGLKYLFTSIFQFKYAKYVYLPLCFFVMATSYFEAGLAKAGRDFIFLLFMSLITFGRVRYKISFDDIRKVIATVDNVIINDWFHGRYELTYSDNKEMIYVGYGYRYIRRISEKFSFNLLKLPLNVKIDGNTLEIEGFLFKTLSIIKSIKKVSTINKSK